MFVVVKLFEVFNMNSVVLVGNLGKVWDVKAFESGKVVAKNSLAILDGKEPTNWANIKVWDKTAELICTHTEKGNTIAIEGELETESWPDSQTGEKRYKTVIKVNRYRIVAKKKNQDSESSENEEEF
jgi:single-strand DNA-binding protein